MDGLYGLEAAQEDEDFGHPSDAAIDAPLPVASQDRRMQVRAYTYWASLLGERDFPSIGDLSAEHFKEFGPHCLLLDFSSNSGSPAIAYLGSALEQECPDSCISAQIADVPPGTLLSRLTAPYRQVLDQRAPAAFESEFVSRLNAPIMYRGLLMPLSSDGSTIDYMLGVINWKERASADQSDAIEREMRTAMRESAAPLKTAPLWPAQSDETPRSILAGARPTVSLADRLALARTAAAQACPRQAGRNGALYRAISLAHDFALAVKAAPKDLASLLSQPGLRAGEAPSAALVAQLVFGDHFAPARVRDFALVLGYATKVDVSMSALAEFLMAYPGGLRALTRQARQRQTVPNVERHIVRFADTINPANIRTDALGHMVLVAQRDTDGAIILRHVLSPTSKAARQAIASILS